MSAQSADSRRRRLLQRGLIGGALREHAPADEDFEASDRFQTSEDSLEIAASTFLGTETTAHRTETKASAIKVSQVDDSRPVACGAGLATIKSLLAGKQPVTWVFTGDNSVQGAFYTKGQRGCVELFSERLRAELRRSMDVVINTGISGDTIAYSLSTLRWRILRFKPDVVVLSLGINDAKEGAEGLAKFERQTRELLDQIRTDGAIPLLILPHPVASSATANREALSDYVQCLRDVAARDEVPCVDHWSFWLKHWPSPAATRKRLHDGRLHLNADSHRQLAALLFETLGIFDPRSASCQCTKSPRGFEVD